VELPDKPAGQAIWVAAAGDTMLGSDIRRGQDGLAPGDGQVLFEAVRSFFEKADLAFVNLEGTLADGLEQTKCGPKSTSCYAFRTPTRYAKALVSAGIDVVSNANNHASDLGVAGMQSTLSALDRVGIAHASRYGDYAVLERKGIKVGFVAAHSGACCLNVNRIDEVAGAIRKLDKQVDIVVLSFHGGAEGAKARHVPGKLEIGYGEKRGDVKKLARAAVDAGADLVLGHGPHVLRAMEVYKKRLIAYSLGNFMGYRQFGMRGGYGGHTVILHVKLAANGVLMEARLQPIRLDRQSIPRPDPKKRGLQHVRELSKSDFPRTGVTVHADGRLSW
jgi:poly-gamma-glutamate capsule biosynthesis protein CapA/YwtB (metallophosphatase superfamily)